MFAQKATDIVQLLSLFLGTIGFSLMYFEMKKPVVINNIELFIDTLEKKVEERCYAILEKGLFHRVFSTAAIIGVFFVALPHFVGFYKQFVPAFAMPLYNGAVILVLAGISLYFSVLLLFAFVDFLAFLNRFNEGKAVGTLGFLIGVISLVGELYQVLSIFMGQE